MKEATRLFDCLQYQLTNFPIADMLAGKEAGQWRKWSSQEVASTVDQLSAGLLQMGIGGGDGSLESRSRVAIISKNRPEWIITDLAVQQTGAILVPMYPNISDNEMQFILADARVAVAFVNDEGLALKIKGMQNQLPELQTVYTYEPTAALPHWTSLLKQADADTLNQLRQLRDNIDAEELVSILYTSGTTGTPKGVMLSHRNIMSDVEGCNPVVREVGIAGKRALSFLPLNHAFERVATYIYILNGTAIYYAESLETIGENLREVKPTMFTTVPRLLEKVYERILAKGAELKGIKKTLFNWAIGLGENYEVNQPRSTWYTAQLAIADKLIFSKWRDAIGGNIKAVIVGAAACPVKLQRVFAAAKIIIQEGYGLTEASPIISGNRYSEKGRMFGTVGPLLHNVQVRIADDGEILCKGPMVMMGYYKRPDLTAAVMTDDWLHTGDIGQLIDNKFLKITDRKKEMFKTSGGKYVAPQPVETKLLESRWIEQVMVVGAEQKMVAALVVPSFLMLKEWYAEQESEYPGNEAASQDPRVYQLIQQDVVLLNHELNPVEQVKKFELLPREWTIEAGELTPTLKLKRKIILEKHQRLIDKIYDSATSHN